MNFKFTLAAAALFAVSCAPKRIPGTDIDDTTETRAILQTIEQYRSAVEARDASGVIALVAENFKDDAGSATPEDDLDYAGLREKLPQHFASLDNVKLEITVKKITVNNDNTANAIYSYTSSYRIPRLTPKVQGDSELEQMWLTRVGNEWKIVSGI